MKRIIALIMALATILSMCSITGAAEENWLSSTDLLPVEVREEVRSCLFPSNGKKDVDAAMELVRPLAEEGNAEAQYYLGWIYDYELDENDDTEKESLYWYELAMQKGFLKAYLGVNLNKFARKSEADVIAYEAICLGILDFSDEELGLDGLELIGNYHYYTEKDYEKALNWYLRAANAGNTRAMNQVGWMYQNGHGVQQNHEQAMEYFLMASEIGVPVAMNNIGWMYQNGYGVAKDYGKAMDWYLQAAEAGDATAMFNLGYMYTEGLGITQSYSKAMDWYLQAAEAGNATAMNNIGWFYKDGLGVARNYSTAMEWCLKAAREGNAVAMNQIGDMYCKGYGVERNVAEAKFWLKKSAELGNADSMHYLGYILEDKLITAAEAMNWYIEAYLHGHEKAEASINAMVAKGFGLEKYYERYGELMFAEDA